MLNMLYNTLGKFTILSLLIFLPLTAFAGTEVYIPLGSANAVAVVDAESDKIIAEIPKINASHGVAISHDGKMLLAGSLSERPIGQALPKPENMSEEEHTAHHSVDKKENKKRDPSYDTVGTAYLIDAVGRTMLHQIDVPGAVHHTLMMPNGRYGILTHPSRSGISVVDIHERRVIKELPTGLTPNYAVSKRDGSRVYVSNTGNNTISEIDTTSWTVLRDLPAGKTPEHIVLSQDENYLYAVNPTVGTVSRLDLKLAKISKTFTVGGDPHGVDLSDNGRFLIASSKEENKVVAFDLASGKEHSVNLTPAPYHVTAIRGTGKVYVSSRKSPIIWVLDQNTLSLQGKIPIRGEGHEMAVVNR
jgi:YVTN family beta-propeller protein